MNTNLPVRPSAVLSADVALTISPPTAGYDADRERVVVAIAPAVVLDLDPGAARQLVDSLMASVDAAEGHWEPDASAAIEALDQWRSDRLIGNAADLVVLNAAERDVIAKVSEWASGYVDAEGDGRVATDAERLREIRRVVRTYERDVLGIVTAPPEGEQ